MKENLSLKQSSEHHRASVWKAHFGALQKLKTLPNDCPLKIAEQLFEGSIVSVGTFSSEHLGPDPELDRFHLNFYKAILRSRKNTSDDALYSISVTAPLHMRQIFLQVSFVCEILATAKESLFYQAMTTAIETAKARKTSWLRKASERVKGSVDWRAVAETVLCKLKKLKTSQVKSQLMGDFDRSLVNRLQGNAA